MGIDIIRGLNRIIPVLIVFVAFVLRLDTYLYHYAKMCLRQYANNKEGMAILTAIVIFFVVFFGILGGMHLVSWTIRGFRNEKKTVPDYQTCQES